MNRINQLVLMVPGKKGYAQTNFRLREFANKQGLAIVHPALVTGLERLREYLRNEYDSDVRIQVTCGTRTEQEMSWQIPVRLDLTGDFFHPITLKRKLKDYLKWLQTCILMQKLEILTCYLPSQQKKIPRFLS